MENQSEKLDHQVAALPSLCLASSRIQFSVQTTVTCPKPDTLWDSPQGDVELMTQKKVLDFKPAW